MKFSDFVSYFILIFGLLDLFGSLDQGLINSEPLDLPISSFILIFELSFIVSRWISILIDFEPLDQILKALDRTMATHCSKV